MLKFNHYHQKNIVNYLIFLRQNKLPFELFSLSFRLSYKMKYIKLQNEMKFRLLKMVPVNEPKRSILMFIDVANFLVNQ